LDLKGFPLYCPALAPGFFLPEIRQIPAGFSLDPDSLFCRYPPGHARMRGYPIALNSK